MKLNIDLDSNRIFEIIKREKTLEKAYVAIMDSCFVEKVCFTEEDKLKLSNTISKLKEKLEDANIKFWIDWGTFLGAYRSNQIIAWDKDIDLGILSKDKNKFIELIKRNPEFFTIEKNEEHYVSLKSKLLKRKWTGAEIDINIWDKLENGSGTFLIGGDCLEPRSYSHFEKLNNIMLEDLDLLLPCPSLSSAETHLEDMNGKNFMLPPGNPLLDSKGQPWSENQGGRLNKNLT